MNETTSLFDPECAGGSRLSYEVCPRCGATAGDDCRDKEARQAQKENIDPMVCRLGETNDVPF